MFADYSGAYGEYGAYGRSLRKSIRKIVSAPIKTVTKVALAPLKATAKIISPITGKILKPLTKIPVLGIGIAAVGGKTGLMKMQKVQSEEAGGEVYMDDNGNYITAAEYNALMAQANAPALTTSQYGLKRPRPAGGGRQKWFEEMFAKKMAEMPKPAVTSTPVYAPAPSGGGGGGGGYVPSVQMTSSSEQMQPEQPYYSQDRIPTEEGSPMQDEFKSENTEETNYDEMDFSGYGLDMETTALLNSEAKTNVPAAIQAGRDYVAKIQGKENTNIGAIVEEPKGLNAIPTWMWLALGVSVFAMVATSSKKR